MYKKTFIHILSLAAILSLIVLPVKAVQAGQAAESDTNDAWLWAKEGLTNYYCFSTFGDHFFQADASGRQHIAFGGCKLYYGVRDAAGWQIETIDNGEQVGSNASLALDRASRPGISYYDQIHHTLKYAQYDGSQWRLQVVDSMDELSSTSLAFDSQDHPQISYIDGGLRYAAWDGSAWITQTIPYDADIWYSSLALDSLDRPVISYLSQGADWQSRVGIAAWDGTAWQHEELGANDEIGLPSLAMQVNGKPAVAFNDADGYLTFARKGASGWSTKVFNVSDAEAIALMIDDKNLAHISYRALYTDKFWVYHTYQNLNQVWKTETAVRYSDEQDDQLNNILFATSIAGEDGGRINIAANFVNGQLVRSFKTDGTWKDEMVAQSQNPQPGQLAIRKVGAIDKVCFSYGDESNGTGTVACGQPGSAWSFSSVGNSSSALAMGPDGNPQVVYADPELTLARWNGTTWQKETITTDPSNVFALALDETGQPHVVSAYWGCPDYFSCYYSDITYHTKRNGVWVTQVISQGTLPQRDTNIGLDKDQLGNFNIQVDKQGRVHVAYTALNSFVYFRKDSDYNWLKVYTQTINSWNPGASMVLDTHDCPHFVISGDGLDYLYGCAKWSPTHINSASAQNPKITLNPSNQPYITYSVYSYPERAYDAQLAYLNGSNFITEGLPLKGGYSSNPAFDSWGRILIAYTGNNQIGYLTGIPFNGYARPTVIYLPSVMNIKFQP